MSMVLTYFGFSVDTAHVPAALSIYLSPHPTHFSIVERPFCHQLSPFPRSHCLVIILSVAGIGPLGLTGPG